MACEDAPCCGCCGPLLDAADAESAAERAYYGDDFYDSDFYEVDDEDEEDEDGGHEDAAMESGLFADA